MIGNYDNRGGEALEKRGRGFSSTFINIYHPCGVDFLAFALLLPLMSSLPSPSASPFYDHYIQHPTKPS